MMINFVSKGKYVQILVYKIEQIPNSKLNVVQWTASLEFSDTTEIAYFQLNNDFK